MQSERAWVDWLQRQAAAHPPSPPIPVRLGGADQREAAGAQPPAKTGRACGPLRLGIGDDAALLAPRRGWELVLTTDMLVEDVHFLRARDSAAVCGRRLATRALSDLAAMGAEPVALLLSTALPAALPAAWARQMVRGLLQAASEAGAQLAGGDSSSTARGIVLDVVGVGQVPPGQALRRSGARPGDRLFVSGRLGDAAWGRELVHGGLPGHSAEARRARSRHCHPRARWELGQALRGFASAALDLSDGLAVDLDHLCRASAVGAVVNRQALPAAPGPAGLHRALFGGEDYELLFTVPPHRHSAALAAAFEIGRITAAPGCWLEDALTQPHRRRLRPQGWQHWRPARR